MVSDNDVFKIGFISRTHGVCGEVEMRITDDVFDRAEAEYLFLRLDGLLVPFFIDSYRFKNDEAVLISFLDVETAEAASRLRGAEVFFPHELVPEERESEVLSWKILTGYAIYGKAEGYIGSVDHVEDLGKSILLCVKTEAGHEQLLPFHPDLVEELNERARTLTLNIPEGLLTLDEQ